MTAEDNEAGDYDEQERANFHDTDAVGEPVGVLCVEHQSFDLVRMRRANVFVVRTYSTWQDCSKLAPCL